MQKRARSQTVPSAIRDLQSPLSAQCGDNEVELLGILLSHEPVRPVDEDDLRERR